jgi:hypothetical protein
VVIGARLRVGVVRRLAGTLAALASVVVAVVGVVRGVDMGTGIPVLVVTVLLGGWLSRLRGVTIRGARTLASVPRPETKTTDRTIRRGVLAGTNGIAAGWFLADPGHVTSSFAFDTSHDGGHDGGHGAFDGGGGHSGH